MREIKFRVWDDNPDYKDYLIDDMAFLRVGGDCLVDDFGQNFPMGDLTIEQYTGLHNDDGAELYEGDILLDPDTGYIVGAVEYKEDRFWCGYDSLIDCTDCQVVGNIHENPELLEVDK